MAKKILEVQVCGKNCKWGFQFTGDTKYLPEWRADGLEINEIVNIIPEWVVDVGLTRLWCLVQDVLYGSWWDLLKRDKKRRDLGGPGDTK